MCKKCTIHTRELFADCARKSSAGGLEPLRGFPLPLDKLHFRFLAALWRIDGHEWRISLVRQQVPSSVNRRGYFTVPSTRQKAARI